MVYSAPHTIVGEVHALKYRFFYLIKIKIKLFSNTLEINKNIENPGYWRY